MKKLTTALVALIMSAGFAAADPLEGIWQTTPDDNGNFGHVQVKPCGAAFCGTLIRAYGADGKQMSSPNVGKRIIWDMQALGSGKYGNGKVWAPDRNKTYNSRMVLSGNRVTVKGCVLGICRNGGTWGRVK